MKINQAQEYLMKIIYDMEANDEDKRFNEECIEKSLNLGQELIDIWEGEEF